MMNDMNYLTALKQKILKEAPHTDPTKPTKGGSLRSQGAFVGFVGCLPATLPNNNAVSDAAQWQEFEALLAIVAPAYDTPSHEYAWAREAARGDLEAALVSYREMAAQIPHMRRHK
jgi:hypothetical protein